MSITLQKAVTPKVSAAYLERGLDRVAGFVLPAADVAEVRTTEGLFELHGLGFPGTPFAPDRPIDVLHLPFSPTAVTLPATGGSDAAGQRATGGTFLDRPPFTGTGFAATGDVLAPLSWLEHTRITPGARLWRFSPGREEPELIGTYHGVVFGWQNHLDQDSFHVLAPSKFVGHVAKLAEGTYAADVRTDDTGAPTLVTVVAVSAGAEEQGFTRTAAGTWAKQLSPAEVPELFEIHASARWHGTPVRIVDQWAGEDAQPYCRVFSLAHDADVAERLGMDKIDAGAYEATVPLSTLTDTVYAQRIPRAWAKPEQVQRAAAVAPGSPARAPLTGAGAGDPGGPRPGATATVRVGPAPGAPADHPMNRFAPELQRVTQGLVGAAPTGWTRARLLCRMVGTRGEILAGATRPDGTEVVLPALPSDVASAMAEIRHKSFRPGQGTWFAALVTLEPGGKLTVTVDHTHEQKWSKPLEPGQYTEDMRRYPRDPEHQPEWLAAILAQEAAEGHGASTD